MRSLSSLYSQLSSADHRRIAQRRRRNSLSIRASRERVSAFANWFSRSRASGDLATTGRSLGGGEGIDCDADIGSSFREKNGWEKVTE
jgi:hypothetical protein